MIFDKERNDVSSDLKGRGAVVTGGARGIGRAICDGLVRAGARVHCFDLEAPASDAIAFHKVDVSNGEQVRAAVAAVGAEASLLVNCAGITRDKSLLKMSDEEWDLVLAINLKGAFNLIRAMGPQMRDAGFGRIVNITSINGLRGKFGQANYCAAKAGLIGLTKTAARELGPKGITVNAVAPGMVLTQMAAALPAQVRQTALDEAVLGRLTEPEDIANAVLFFLSDAARNITGQVLQVDAGQYL